MSKKFRILTTSSFERELKKLLKKQKQIINTFESVINILEKDALGTQKTNNIKKLSGIKKGEGGWRIRLGDFRIRYDIVGSDIILHSIKNRKDAYK
jgi:addiction module RelE/StbE family toxin